DGWVGDWAVVFLGDYSRWLAVLRIRAMHCTCAGLCFAFEDPTRAWVFDIVFCSDEGREAQSDRGFENSYRQQGECVVRKDPPEIKHPYIFSVSQAQTFELCPRKWAYQKIDGLPDPGNEASQLGGEVHEELEEYLEKGTPIGTDRAGKIAMSGLPHLPPPMYPGMRIEDWFHVKIGNYQGKHGVGAYYRGLKDVEIRAGWKRKGVPFVSDHKTTKNFMWLKTPEDLTGGVSGVGDMQAGLYAYDTMLQAVVDLVELQWTYMRTTGAPVAEPSITLITREQVDRIIHKLELTTAEMIRTKDEHPTALTVVQDPTGCSAFGGCPYQGLCKLTPQEKLKAMVKQVAKESG